MTDEVDMSVVYSKEPTPSPTKDLGEAYCPLCQPDRDPFEKLPDGKVLFVKLCGHHDEQPSGEADSAARVSDRYLSGGGPAVGSESNAAACDVVHRPSENP